MGEGPNLSAWTVHILPPETLSMIETFLWFLSSNSLRFKETATWLSSVKDPYNIYKGPTQLYGPSPQAWPKRIKHLSRMCQVTRTHWYRCKGPSKSPPPDSEVHDPTGSWMSLHSRSGSTTFKRKKEHQNKHDINESPTEPPQQLGTIWTNENQNPSSQAKPL